MGPLSMDSNRLFVLFSLAFALTSPGNAVAGLSFETNDFQLVKQIWCQQVTADTDSNESEDEETDEDEEPDCE